MPPVRERFAAFATPLIVTLAFALGGCGGATGERPVAGDAGGAGSRPDGVFGDPTSPPGDERITVVDTLDADVSARPSLPLDGPSSVPDAPVFADPASANPFETPDPTASTLVGRMGRAPLVDLADALVAARFVDDYLRIDADVAALVLADDFGFGEVLGDETLDCPEGGRVGVRREPSVRDSVLALAFDGCGIGGTILSGSLGRSAMLEGFRFETSESLELIFDGLVVDGSDGHATTLSGTTRRVTARRVDTECDGEDVELALVHRIDAASIARDGSTVRAVNVRHDLERASLRSTPNGEPTDCHERTTIAFDGSASASGGPFGSGSATIERRGSLERDSRGDREPPSDATLRIESDDGSSLALRLLSDPDATAQADVIADAAAMSWTVEYRFEP